MTNYHDSHLIETLGKILILTIVALSVIFIVVFFVHLYAKCFCFRREQQPSSTTTRHHRHRHELPSGVTGVTGVTVLRRGLNPKFLETIPVVPFDEFKDGLECTICLSELVEGEKGRILPKCGHGFHVECIDMWFHSHSTCPICRTCVSDESTEISIENLLENQRELSISESGDFPTNILFWGDETEVSTLTSQLEEANSHNQTLSSSYRSNDRARLDLVIDVPTDYDEEEVDEKSPVSSRMGSLRRILSGSRRFINPFGPANTNIEQGIRSHL